MGLSAEDLAQRLPSAKQTTFRNRLAWAKAHLKGAGLVESPRRAVYRLTDAGRSAIAENPSTIDMHYLSRYTDYVAFRQRSAAIEAPAIATSVPQSELSDTRTPDDLIEDGLRQLEAALIIDLRERVAIMPPSDFEHLVVELLQAMGYGGPQENAGLVVGRGGDEGIDGVIRQDRLGLDKIYVQAKRWQGPVGRPEVQRFAGALQGQRAQKGVLITSSSFTKDALAYPSTIQTTIILVDGSQLAQLMIEHEIGVTSVKSVKIKRVDSDYFTAE